MSLRSTLDAARRSLLSVDLRSPFINFSSDKRAPKIERCERHPTCWRILDANRAAMHDLRNAATKNELAIFTDFVWFTLDKSRFVRLRGAMRTIPAGLAVDGRTAFETGPAIENQQLIDLLAKHGLIVERTPDGYRLDQAEPGAALDGGFRPTAHFLETCRVGRCPAMAMGADRYLDHAGHPAILKNSLLRLFAEPPSRSNSSGPDSSQEADLSIIASVPASERLDDIEAHEMRSRAEPASRFVLDPDQREAVRLALSTTAMVIDGPPGTGKSQVIGAIAEQVIRARKKAILTSTVSSALDVARRRLREFVGIESSLLIGTPDEVAAFAPAVIGEPDFDLLIIDECGRMPFETALSLLSRARGVILVGDDRQLRPDAPGETILDRATALRIPRTSLRHHYRSQNAWLITVSNILAYNMQLRTVPTARINRSNGVRVVDLHAGKTELWNGKTGAINVSEAHAIAAKVAELKSDGDPRSIGIITANDSQRRYLAGLLRDTNRNANDIEPLFVRASHQVQGEERDIILISTVYDGRDPSDRFGLFDQPNSVERLNVMLSRSRAEMWIFTSFRRSTPRAKSPPSRGRITYEGMRMLLDVMTEAENRLPLQRAVAASAQRLGMQADNLGIVYGLRYRHEDLYRAGLVVTDETKSAEHWLAIVDQLKTAGWSVAIITDVELKQKPTSPVELIQEALRVPSGR